MEPQISTIAVLGAGTMGRGIAHVAAQAGYVTFLYDTSPEALKKAEASIHRNLDKGVELKKLAADVAERAKRSLHLHSDLAVALEKADPAIESAPETMALEGAPSPAAALHAPKPALFASSPSALSITEMAAASGRPERFAGMHFFNP